jgi:hypothetical protein
MYKDVLNSYHCQKQDSKWYGISTSTSLKPSYMFSANGQNLIDFRPEANLS